MPTFYSDQMTAIQAQKAGGHDELNSNQLGGRLRVALFSYSASGTEATSDVIYLCRLPPNSRVMAMWLAYEDFGTTFTANIGDSGSATRLASSLALGTAASGAWALLALDGTAGIEPSTGLCYKYAAETDIILTATSVATPSAGAQLRGFILYASD